MKLRRRGVLKWTGTAVCTLLVGIYFVCARWEIAWCLQDNYGVIVLGGRACFGRVIGVHVRSLSPGWNLIRPDEAGFRMQWWPDFGIDRWGSHSFSVSLWVPFLLAAAPTSLLWRLDRRRPPGACPKCGYDLTGNTTGVCPECGATAGADSRTGGL